MKCKNCNKSFTKNSSSLSAVIHNKLCAFCSDTCYSKYCLRSKCKYDPSLTYHVARKNTYFNHISSYPSFKDFKKELLHFLKTISFNDIRKDSFQFASSMGYKPDYQKTQIKAINTVFDQLYGKNKVRWGFINPPEYDTRGDFFWAPYLVIDEETFFYYPKNKLKLDTFIRKKLRNKKSVLKTGRIYED